MIVNISEIDLYKRIEELESENRFLHAENKRLREALGLPLENIASKQDIDKLIFDILPDVLDKQQRENKVRNLLYALHKRDKSIVNQGTNRNPKLVLSLSK